MPFVKKDKHAAVSTRKVSMNSAKIFLC